MNDNMMSNATVRQGLDKQIYLLRSMFYLLHPNETYFKELDEVPDFTAQVSYQ